MSDNIPQQQSANKLRVAVVGLGIGQHHLRAYQKLSDYFEIAALCDIDQAKMQPIATDLGISAITTDLAELCRMEDVDIIDICTPPHLHVPQALQALEAGKYVICEKPLASSLAAVDELAEAEKRTGKRVMPIFQYRFGNGLQKLRYLIEAGLTGRAYLATIETAWRRRPEYYAVPWRGKWKTELGGAIVGHAIHAHDALFYVLGPAKNLFARTAMLVNAIEVEDCASISLELASGALASLSVTLGSTVEITRHRYCFSNLTAESNTQPYASNTADPWQFTGDTPELTAQIEETLKDYTPQPEGFEGQFLRFYQALQQNTELPVTLADARRSLELITAIYYSARTKQPVELPLGSTQPLYEGWAP
jgi:predicted dehydrogenase